MKTNDPTAPELVVHAAATTATVRDVVDVADLPAFFDRSFSTLSSVIAAQGIDIISPAFALYHGPPGETADIEVGFVTAGTVAADGPVRSGALPGGRVARLVHHGSFDELGSSWERLRSWIEAHDLTATGPLWEVYLTEPSPEMDPADLRTELNWPVS